MKKRTKNKNKNKNIPILLVDDSQYKDEPINRDPSRVIKHLWQILMPFDS